MDQPSFAIRTSARPRLPACRATAAIDKGHSICRVSDVKASSQRRYSTLPLAIAPTTPTHSETQNGRNRVTAKASALRLAALGPGTVLAPATRSLAWSAYAALHWHGAGAGSRYRLRCWLQGCKVLLQCTGTRDRALCPSVHSSSLSRNFELCKHRTFFLDFYFSFPAEVGPRAKEPRHTTVDGSCSFARS